MGCSAGTVMIAVGGAFVVSFFIMTMEGLLKGSWRGPRWGEEERQRMLNLATGRSFFSVVEGEEEQEEIHNNEKKLLSALFVRSKSRVTEFS